jgi:hypothetical protein
MGRPFTHAIHPLTNHHHHHHHTRHPPTHQPPPPPPLTPSTHSPTTTTTTTHAIHHHHLPPQPLLITANTQPTTRTTTTKTNTTTSTPLTTTTTHHSPTTNHQPPNHPTTNHQPSTITPTIQLQVGNQFHRRGAVKKFRGRLNLRVRLEKSGVNQTLVVDLEDARDLLTARDDGETSPFVKMFLSVDAKKEKKKVKELKPQKTAVHDDTRNPIFKEGCVCLS